MPVDSITDQIAGACELEDMGGNLWSIVFLGRYLAHTWISSLFKRPERTASVIWYLRKLTRPNNIWHLIKKKTSLNSLEMESS